MKMAIRITKLTVSAMLLNSAIDSKKYDYIDLDDVYTCIDNKTILSFIEDELGRDIDFSLLEERDRVELQNEWADMALVIDPRRKMGVENSGLCLLMGFLLEGIQRRQDNNPR
jgi:hypothetical protein